LIRRFLSLIVATVGSITSLAVTSSPSSQPILWVGLAILLIREFAGSAHRYHPLELLSLPAGFLFLLGPDHTQKLGWMFIALFVALRISDRPLGDLSLFLAAVAFTGCYADLLKQTGEWGTVALTVAMLAATLLLLYHRYVPVWLPPVAVFVCRTVLMGAGYPESAVFALAVLCVSPHALRTMRHAHPYYAGAAALLLPLSALSKSTLPLLLLVAVDRTWHTWHPLTAPPGYPLWARGNLWRMFPDCASLIDVPFERLLKRTRRDRETGYITVEVEQEQDGALFFESRRIYIKRAELNLLRLLGQTLLKMRVPFSDFGEEVRAYVALSSAGLKGPEPLVACTETRFIFRKTALATLDIGPFQRLNRLVEKQDVQSRRRTVRQVARLVARMHNAAINHRDLYGEHIAIRPNGDVVFLDLNRAQVRHRLPRRWVVKDLAALFVSTDVPATDRLRFFLAYLDVPHLTQQAKELARAVLARAQKLAKRRAKQKQREKENGSIIPPD